MKVFGGSANIKLAKLIADEMGLPLSQIETHIFPDGEKRIRIIDPVVDEHCVVVQPTSTPADQNFMELFFIVDALKRSGASQVTAVVPYLGYQRQDHIFRDGEAVSLEVVVKTLEAVGTDNVIAVDLHSVKIPEVFKIPVTHLSALPLFAKKIKAEKIGNGEGVLISPDMGGIRRIKILSDLLGGMPYGAIEKDRDLITGSVEAKDMELHGITDVKGKTAIIVDDMISSGGTIVKAVDLLKEKGFTKVYVFATHAVFSQNAPTLLMDASIEKVFVTNSVLIPADKKFPKLEVISLAEMIVETLTEKS